MTHHVLRRALAAMLRYAHAQAGPGDPLRAVIDGWLVELEEMGRGSRRVQ